MLWVAGYQEEFLPTFSKTTRRILQLTKFASDLNGDEDYFIGGYSEHFDAFSSYWGSKRDQLQEKLGDPKVKASKKESIKVYQECIEKVFYTFNEIDKLMMGAHPDAPYDEDDFVPPTGSIDEIGPVVGEQVCVCVDLLLWAQLL